MTPDPSLSDTALDGFHPAVVNWFRAHFAAPTAAQARAWPLIRARRSTLVAAPTGSGKTLTAFLAALDELVRDGIAGGGVLPDETRVVYVSPLKALSNDIRVNLQEPLAGIAEQLQETGAAAPEIRAAVRTGDTTQQERNAVRKRPPHILVTTPESLYVLLSSDSGRAMLSTTRTVIVDEIHAVAGTKRGSHLSLSLERLDALCEARGAARPVRVGLSATQKPIELVARFLAGEGQPCEIVDVGHVRARDLALELPPMPLEAIMSNDMWERVYDRLAELSAQHRTTLVFVNTRRMAERAARHLTDRLGKDAVAAHHGSLAREHRLDAEQRLKRGELRVLIATASLELGIDIGDVDLVCQIGSPGSIGAFLQRVGRSGHHVGGVPKGRLFPTSRDDLIECAALLDCVRRGELDALTIPRAPLDVLAQQITAEVAFREWGEDELFGRIRRAYPYATLERARYDAVLRTLAEGYTGRQGVRGAYVHRDAVSRTLRGRRGGKLTAVTSGGAIPDNADFAVLLEPQGLQIGTVNEDFAVESLAGDVFQLGNTSYRIVRVEGGRVRVENANGQPPNIPFWLGEAPGRSDELSFAIARLRANIDARLGGADDAGAANRPGVKQSGEAAQVAPAAFQASDAATAWLAEEAGIGMEAARQIVDYLARSRAALSVLPTQDTLVMERFFDESGGTQLVIHAPFGSRVNRAWGLALRKRFCRTFNFELQAAATEDAIVLSLTASHSFALDEVWRYLKPATAEHLLIQALLDAPLFGVRWRWNATNALALPRYAGGRKVAPQLQRMKSEDLLAAVFPDQVACAENVVGERDVPAHPLVEQTIDDCLHDAMDSDAWLALLRRIEEGAVRLVTRDLPAPSPLAAEILSARPYAFLDDAPLEERRTQAVLARRWTDPQSTGDLGALDAEAIASVRGEAWPSVTSADEMHEALTGLSCITDAEAAASDGWPAWLDALARAGRATRLRIADDDALWTPVERLACVRAVYAHAPMHPRLAPPPGFDAAWSEDDALVEIVRARLSGFGPLTVAEIARPLALPASAIAIALTRLESEGYVMRGHFTPGADEQWCERHLLARIHRYTVRRLRREIEPVERQDFMRFLFEWQRVAPDTHGEGRDALAAVLEQLEGFEAPAVAWEDEILPARIADYSGIWLDEICRAGKIVWSRPAGRSRATGGPVRGTPIVLLPRRQLAAWNALMAGDEAPEQSSRAERVFEALSAHGAMFFDELLADTRLLRTELEDALGELVALGLVNADSFAGLRALLAPAAKRNALSRRSRGRAGGLFIGGMDDAGRWALLRRANAAEQGGDIQHVARTLLRRYGVVFWRLLEREAQWLPPWRDLLRVYHRLEARGEIRGGRFVAGLAGEQFALAEAVPLLRDMRRRPKDGVFVALSAVDPLNLVGTLLPGEKVPALAGNRVLYRDGVPVGAVIAGKTRYFADARDMDGETRERMRLALARRTARSVSASAVAHG
ncbi:MULTISPECIES: DEAD/DEAH box helicase [unclassified Caballeronia]|uniref:DEAD/DEAH box helicase n=1 Tax=unclassified Caballeronia TaxID=2646786 RepID=UPI0028654899|nr:MULTISPECIES: DEAD/DEAH box helicase [unclassified Caballeronia]MDR5739595.1 DEAD/DEAH box helicase [Caballeronia sp. LZ016]MDR5808062.1 DEAD/DEAH box helicase [Caballeronia sp. LZ019]